MTQDKRTPPATLPCPTCNRGLQIRISKKGKPYCVCFDCGDQVFIRGKKGIQGLKKKTGFDIGLCLKQSKADLGREERIAHLKKELERVNREIEKDLWEDRPELRKERDDLLWEIRIYGG